MLTINRSTRWDAIKQSYFKLRKRQHDDELDRALLLQQIRDKSPWLDRQRYTSQAAYDELVEYTFEDIARHVLGDSTKEVNNTLRALDTFGKVKFARFGRNALVCVYNRCPTARQRNKTFVDMEKAMQHRMAPGLPGGTVSNICDKHAPETRRVPVDNLAMVKKLKDKNTALRKQLKAKDVEIATLRRELSKTKRKKRAA